ncbi:MAG: alpha/beta fold hydrolase [Polyangiaceae bacterium]|nr:alpha/beta fold hydrolase [Polyangiaceae bacterium]
MKLTLPRSTHSVTPLLVAASALTVACADIDDPIPEPSITWAECETSSLVECGTLEVPIDHTDPYGPTFTLPVVRKEAANPEERIGSILFNPGGPGGSGANLVRAAWIIMPPEVRARFDLIGFDPRGQAGSTPPIHCLDDISTFAALDTTPDNSAELTEIQTQSQTLADACAEQSGDILPFIGTNAIVQDMDLLRRALGDEKLTYVGFSYGTFLGAMYAEKYPTHVRALVLDGVVDPSQTVEELIVGQALGFETALNSFFQACAADAACVVHNNGSPESVYDAVQAAVEASPLPTAFEGRTVGPGEFAYGVGAALYQPGAWGELAAALSTASFGDGTLLLALADGYLGRNDDGTYDNGMGVYYAVTSVDAPSERSLSTFQNLTAQMAEQAPRIGAYLPFTSYPSAVWPVKPWRQAQPIQDNGIPPLLLIGNTRDPATPYASAVEVANQLPNSVLLTLDGDGHTAFLKGNNCIDEAVVSYLVNLTLPDKNTICTP